MEATFEAAAVLVIALLPGAVYTWSFERIAGRWGISLSDRLYRFFGLSAFFQALIAPLTWKVWRAYIRHGAPHAGNLPWWLWPSLLGYLTVPASLGALIAHGFRRKNKLAKWIVGSTGAPTAWDAVFSSEFSGYVLLRLKSGAWIGGKYADGSHVAGYPEPADIYLAQEYRVDQDTGDFVRASPDESPQPVGNYGVLLRWSEVEYLEISD
jgi:hypothetical protein